MDLPGVVDAALDRSIALGYGHVGLRVRRALPGRPAERAAAQIRLQVPGADVRPVACDRSSLAALREFAARRRGLRGGPERAVGDVRPARPRRCGA